MEIRFAPLELPRIDALRFEAAALPFFADERPLRGAAGLCDWRLCGRLSRVLAKGRVNGQCGESILIPARPRLPFDKLVLFGLGARAEFDRKAYEAIVEHILSALRRLRLRTFVLALPGRSTGQLDPDEAIRWFLPLAADQPDLDEVVILEDIEAHRAMQPIVDAERRRLRAARDLP